MELDASLNELNDLAGRLAVLDETEQEAFDGLLRLEIQRKVESNGSILTMQDLRTLAVSAGADCCHVVGATSDAELGRFYAENGFMEELDGLSDDVFEMLDFGKIGKALRTGENGTFTRSGYVVNHSELVTAPPCAKELPEKPEYLFRLTLGLHPDLEDDRTVTLELPASAEALREVQKQLGADGWEGATNLFCCVKNRPLALLAELGFLPLNTRDDFNVLYKFLSKGEITDDYLQEEMELTEILLKPPEAEAIRTLLLERAPRGDVRRAADFFKLVRYSFSGSSKSFGGKPCDIRRFFHLIWECSRRLANVIVENKDFEDVIRQYDRGDAWIYCDPPYFEAECYEVAFPKENHQRLHDTLLNCHGYVMVSYNYCPYICELYQEFYIFRVVRPNSMSQTAGSEYEEVIITNYDPRKVCWQLSLESLLNCGSEARYELIHEPERPIKTTN